MSIAPVHLAISSDFFPKLGGAHKWLYEAYKRWPQSVVVLADAGEASGDAASAQAFDALGHGSLRIIRSDFGISTMDVFRWSYLRRLIRLVRRILQLLPRQGGTLHCLRAYPDGFLGLLAKVAMPWKRPKLVVLAHGEEVLIARSSRQLNLATKLVYRYADLVISNSQSTAALVRSAAPHARIACVSPGVDLGACQASPEVREEFRSALNVPEGATVVLTVARMEPRKNHQMMLEAVARLRQEGFNLLYVCIGDGEQLETLRGKSRELGLERYVRFLGAVSEAEKWAAFSCCDIFAMPSVQLGSVTEGFGIVFIEAAANGRPSIAGNAGGQSEAVLDGETGFCVDGSSATEVVAALRRLVSDPPLRIAMGERAREWAGKHDWSLVSRRMQEELNAVLQA